MSDATYGPKVYIKQGGDEIVVANGGKVTVEAGGVIAVDGVEISYLEIKKLSGTTFATSDLNTLTGVAATAAVQGVSAVTGDGSAAVSLIFCNAEGTAISTSFAGHAAIATNTAGTTFGAVSGISGISGSVGNIVSGGFDFITTVSGRLGVNIVKGASTAYITFTMPSGKKSATSAITTL